MIGESIILLDWRALAIALGIQFVLLFLVIGLVWKIAMTITERIRALVQQKDITIATEKARADAAEANGVALQAQLNTAIDNAAASELPIVAVLDELGAPK